MYESACQGNKLHQRALVPKLPNLSKVSESRPISSSNTLRKIISKLIANRIKAVLPDIIRVMTHPNPRLLLAIIPNSHDAMDPNLHYL